MAFTPQEMHDALARSSGSAATAIAHHVLRVGGEAMRDARYPELERQMGPDAARRLVLDTGIAAYSDRFLRDNPSLRPSETTQADAERKTFNALQSLFPHAPAERVGSKAAELFGRLGRGQQLQMAASDAGTAAAILSSVLHVDPNAVRAKAQKHAAGGPDAATGAGEHGDRAHRLKGGAFARDAFGHHIHGGDQKGGSGSSERYNLLPGNNAITYGAERYSFAQMSQYAAAQGVPWAVHSPELLKLGPSALKVLGDTHFKQESFQRLTKGAGFHAKDAVNIARFAQGRHMDASHLSDDVSGTVVGLEPGKTPESKARRGDLVHAYSHFFAEPKSDEAKKGVLKLRPRYEKSPMQLQKFDNLNRKLGIQAQAENKATVKAAASVAAAAPKVAVADVKSVKADAKATTADAKVAKADAAGAQLAQLKAKSPAASL